MKLRKKISKNLLSQKMIVDVLSERESSLLNIFLFLFLFLPKFNQGQTHLLVALVINADP